MRSRLLLLILREWLSNPRLLIAVALLALALAGYSVLADEDGPEIPGAPCPPDPDPFP